MKEDVKKTLLSLFGQSYPRCAGLPIHPLQTPDGANLRPAFDVDDVQGLLGTVRFNKLLAQVGTVYVYPNPANHPKQASHARAIHADDLEAFLAGGN